MIRVQVTNDHISKSTPNEPMDGVLSNAIADCFTNLVFIYVDGAETALYVYDGDDYKHRQQATLPVIAQRNNDKFNAGEEIEPFAFYVDFYINI